MYKKIIGVLLIAFVSLVTVAKTDFVGPIKVEIVQQANGFQMLRDGKPYFVKGAGGNKYLSRIAAYGGNSIRTWSTQGAKQILDSAQQLGLTVLLGLPMVAERHGFDYNDAKAVQAQFENVKAEVLKFKDHPALLGWGIGNELNLSYRNVKVWDAVNEIAEMIHEVDPNHPTTTILAGINKKEVDQIKTNAKAIDFLAINTYGGLANLPEVIAAAGWQGAYMVTEWGPTGHWECQLTTWGAPIEETSSEKAAVYKIRYEKGIDQKDCLGSYVFLWGQKQERTPTWYGLFTDKGEETAVIDEIHYLWSTKYPKNRAPHLASFVLNGQQAKNSITLKRGKSYNAKVQVIDPDNDQLHYNWELLPEATKVGEGGDHEDKPLPLALSVKNKTTNQIMLSSPTTKGAYRLFVYITDGHNNVATANIPFYVN